MNNYNIVRFEALQHGKNKKFHIEDWDIENVIELVDLKDYKCFWFEQIESEIIEEPGKYTVKSHVKKQSGIHFINGFIETIEDVKIRDPELLYQMDRKKCDKIVSGIKHDWSYCFDESKDSVVELK